VTTSTIGLRFFCALRVSVALATGGR